MARRPRTTRPGFLTEVTVKAVQGRFLLAPSHRFNRILIGVLGRAQRHYGLEVCVVVAMSNHLHILCVPQSAVQLSSFCQFFASNLSREIGVLRGWTGGVFRRRCSQIVVTHEEVAHLGRLRYLLAHGMKEGLVRSPEEWPGVHTGRELLDGKWSLEGVWVNRTKLDRMERAYRRNEKVKGARVRLEKPAEARCEKIETLELSKVPCWSHLDDRRYRVAIREIFDGILQEYAPVRRYVPLNARERILRQDPQQRPEQTKRSPAPLCHAATQEERFAFYEFLVEWVARFRRASKRFVCGDATAVALFPDQAFLPATAGAVFIAAAARAGPALE